jgi:hypothetical protein
VRVVYLDETGHSLKEPVAAVAGIILNPDKEWKVLAAEIEILKGRVPAKFRDGFIFHAADLFYGGKYRQGWSDEDRWLLLESLLALPRKLKIPLVVGSSQKLPKEDRAEPHLDSILIHAMAYMLCLKAADIFMINCAPSDEVAMVIAEERQEARKALRAAHNLAINRELVEQWLPEFTHLFPISRVKAPPAFAAKDEELLLQMADACAWIFQRYIRGATNPSDLSQPCLANLPIRLTSDKCAPMPRVIIASPGSVDQSWCYAGLTRLGALLRRHDLSERDLKIFHTLIDAKLSSGCDEPLELLLVRSDRTTLEASSLLHPTEIRPDDTPHCRCDR